jgi:hypothetical protein
LGAVEDWEALIDSEKSETIYDRALVDRYVFRQPDKSHPYSDVTSLYPDV